MTAKAAKCLGSKHRFLDCPGREVLRRLGIRKVVHADDSTSTQDRNNADGGTHRAAIVIERQSAVNRAAFEINVE